MSDAADNFSGSGGDGATHENGGSACARVFFDSGRFAALSHADEGNDLLPYSGIISCVPDSLSHGGLDVGRDVAEFLASFVNGFITVDCSDDFGWVSVVRSGENALNNGGRVVNSFSQGG